MDVVASVVGMIPEGLVLLISLAFGVAAIRLAAQKVLIQELAAVEILARVDVLCLDKTGTLTSGTVSFTRADAVGARAAAHDAAMAAALVLLRARRGRERHREVAARPLPGGRRERASPACRSRASGSAAASSASSTGSSRRGCSGRRSGCSRSTRSSRPTAAAHQAAGASHARTGPPARCRCPRWTSSTSSGSTPSRRAVLLFGEEIRPDAASTLQYFKEQGVRCIIISGDNPTTVAALANGTRGRHVVAGRGGAARRRRRSARRWPSTASSVG